MYYFFQLIGCHFIGDFPFQGDWLSNGKGKSWQFMFIHCAIYASTFIIFAKISLPFAALIFFSHFIIDPLKARYKIIKFLWLDQSLHILVIIIGFYFHL